MRRDIMRTFSTHSPKSRAVGLLLGLATLAGFVLIPAVMQAGISPSVTVSDQTVKNGSIVIPEVVSDGPGWIVIHIQADGKPGPVIGYTRVTSGWNRDVGVKIDESRITATLYAMLHEDDQELGVYEFPGADGPVKVGGGILVKPFRILGENAGRVSIDIRNFDFSKNRLTVSPGTTVEWENYDGVPHTVTANNGSFDSGRMRRGEEYRYTFNEEGTYSYYCVYHPSMKGTVEVR